MHRDPVTAVQRCETVRSW